MSYVMLWIGQASATSRGAVSWPKEVRWGRAENVWPLRREDCGPAVQAG